MTKPTGTLWICVVATLAGVGIGFVGGAFRWCLHVAERWRVELVEWVHQLADPGWVVPIAFAAAGATAAALVVRWVPLAAGSGIQHVEAVYRGTAQPPGLLLLPAKFIGGVLAIGSGLVLGREGPTVHMGAVIGTQAARRAGLAEPDVRMMQTVLGGAGLAVAFNAPIGGVLFTLEEATKSVRMRTVLPTIFAAGTAVACSRWLFGDHPDFGVEPVAAPALALLPVFVVFGLATGGLGVLYSRMVLTVLDGVAAVPRVPMIAKATVIGGLVGLVMLLDPRAVGGGDTVTQLIVGGGALALPVVLFLLAARLVAGPLSYASAVPGGLFAPLLAVGALWGMLFVGGLNILWPNDGASLVVPMAIAGMAAFFGAVVRAPLTAVVLVIEMTATTSLTVPMLAATAAAVLVAELLKSPPIYDSLRAKLPVRR
ncbi:ClC family H(+)/Cl(-) exchange transporter [Mycolicibacterium diernhoferi]|uniref:ClC family H(+)/Cl(-) exchange transporter n=2 Tax=Mycolicibacterium TaxID=1866885 RepID=A0A1Q4H5U1_9MYCO|nr:ClC family H(+)/Cl(-) exchange transporter [Mycolicibacterium diernhoferi]OJZ62908.1 ClC family H(+)/Cl(-) exchange transporter [Mycolicibacterium diernhoferi]OPE54940.1 ClC family H(+)/Cl(-) exchange transporter [Mycolicibacterium diernhoferi]PEG54728.1 ClC family H(+)/Cl(-) exchange transporter [Mycolicibacterium diernhoferi]QYL22947.1 ClC family H(+)/Cl(-) exchange transporter [Mycolicibacterium diernhoferi]